MFITIVGAAWHYGSGSDQMMRSGSATLVSTLWRIAKGSSGSKTARGNTLWRTAKGLPGTPKASKLPEAPPNWPEDSYEDEGQIGRQRSRQS
jgi:hypothetical protein